MNTPINKADMIAKGKRLKIVRRMLKMTQEQFAEAIERTQSMVVKYENGLSSIPASVIQLLFEKYQISFEWFNTGQGEKKATPSKDNLLKNIADLKTMVEMLEIRVTNMEKREKQLIRELYEMKHGV